MMSNRGAVEPPRSYDFGAETQAPKRRSDHYSRFRRRFDIRVFRGRQGVFDAIHDHSKRATWVVWAK
jgi:hypothetical protein